MGLSGKIWKNEVVSFDLSGFLKNFRSGIRASKSPVFIIGCGHSGTTMLRHLLSLHHNLYAPSYESRMFLHSGFKIRFAAAVWSFVAISKGKSRWVEKTPSHIHCIERIFKYYPDARIILLIRDGRDVAMSLYKRWGDLDRSIRRWMDDNRAAESYWSHPQVLKLNYELLIADYENQMRKICNFIDEPFDEALLSFSRKKSGEELSMKISDDKGARPNALRDAQIQKGLYNGNGRWSIEMTEDQKVQFKQLAGQMLIETGHADDLNW